MDLLDFTQYPEVDNDIGFVQYISGFSNDQPYWAYVVMRPSKYLEYYNLISQGTEVELADFGEILYEGYEEEPPVELQKIILSTYAGDERINNITQSLGQTFQNLESAG